MKQWQIFVAFFRSGMLGYGGGPSSIPLVHKEVVETFKWMDSDEFGDILALANALPGPINTKMAGYIGYRLAGITGMLTALFATAVPTIILMIVLLTGLQSFKDKPWVQGAANAVVPVVAVMLGTLTWDFIKKSGKSSLGWKWTGVFLIGSLIILEVIGLHPAFLIFGLLLFALLMRNSGNGTKKKEKGTT
jgi:chromate transporter